MFKIRSKNRVENKAKFSKLWSACTLVITATLIISCTLIESEVVDNLSIIIDKSPEVLPFSDPENIGG